MIRQKITSKFPSAILRAFGISSPPAVNVTGADGTDRVSGTTIRNLKNIKLVSLLITAVVCACCLVVLTSAPAETRTAKPRTLSAKVDGFPGSTQAAGVAALDAWKRKTGFYPANVLWFEEFGKYEIASHKFASAASRRVTPDVTLNPFGVSLASINAGSYNAWLDRFARTVAAHPGPVKVRFAHEMNGGWFPWGRQPKAYKAAFRKVSARVKAKAPNARMVFAPNVGQDDLRKYYPGNAYVDVLALDGYDFNRGADTCSEIFAASYDKLASLSSTKPVSIEETATGAGTHKPAWIRNTHLSCVPQRLPRVRNINWFDTNKERDWRVNSSRASLRAYKSVEASPGWRGRR